MMGIFDKARNQQFQQQYMSQQVVDNPQSSFRQCQMCGAPVQTESAKFCGRCGAALPAQRASDTPIVFLDIETPNRKNDRICSIGLVKVDEYGREVIRESLLIDPECDFDTINTAIHGIHERDVRGKANFDLAWHQSIYPIVHDAKLVAHNASYDLSVMDKTMAAYGIPHGPIRYACTMAISTELVKGVDRYSLDRLCAYFSIPLERHHDAMNDAAACAALFTRLNSMFGVLGNDDMWHEYIPFAERSAHRAICYNVQRTAKSKALERLVDLARDIIADGRISLDEAIVLRWNIQHNENLLNDKMANGLLGILSSVLEDGAITADEEAALLKELSHMVDPIDGVESIVDDMHGKKFCVSGDFDFGSKESVAAALVAQGGIESKSVTKTCDYVIVGANGSSAYAYGSYGTKVKKAMEWQGKGAPIKIVSEHDVSCLR